MGQTMTRASQSNMTDREAWVLRLLYAPNEKGISSPIYGKTRMVKGMFLLQRMLKESFNVDAGFNFQPHKYGPFDNQVYVALEQLEQQGRIETESEDEHDTKYNGIKYTLSRQGRQEAKKLYDSLPEERQDLVEWVKYKQLMRSLGALLAYVYMEYPEMTTQSELLS